MFHSSLSSHPGNKKRKTVFARVFSMYRVLTSVLCLYVCEHKKSPMDWKVAEGGASSGDRVILATFLGSPPFNSPSIYNCWIKDFKKYDPAYSLYHLFMDLLLVNLLISLQPPVVINSASSLSAGKKKFFLVVVLNWSLTSFSKCNKFRYCVF